MAAAKRRVIGKYGLALKRARVAAGIDQDEAAERAGVSQGAISRWEANKRALGLDEAVRLARAYGCTVDALLGRENPTPTQAIQDLTKEVHGMREELSDIRHVAVTPKRAR